MFFLSKVIVLATVFKLAFNLHSSTSCLQGVPWQNKREIFALDAKKMPRTSEEFTFSTHGMNGFFFFEIFIKVTKITIRQLKTQGLIHDTLYNIQPGLLHAYIY